MKELPVSIANFSEISQENYLYADKTEFLYNLVRFKKPYFLSRPRRFGKTLLISTLEAIFEGRRDLFKGFWIDGSNYDWTPYPVIHLSLNSNTIINPEALDQSLSYDLLEIADTAQVKLRGNNAVDLLKSLIRRLYTQDANKKENKQNKGVVVLIDEYDLPIINYITDDLMANAMRMFLKNFYGVLKGEGKYLRFIFITGVTKFAKISLFSELNNLADLTLNDNFATICGFTVSEFDSLFSEHLTGSLAKFKTKSWLDQEATVDDLRIRFWIGTMATLGTGKPES
jgi:hypothetical protein